METGIENLIRTKRSPGTGAARQQGIGENLPMALLLNMGRFYLEEKIPR